MKRMKIMKEMKTRKGMRIVLVMMLLLASWGLSAQNKLTVEFSGIEEIKGHLMVALQDDSTFMGNSLQARMLKIESNTISVVFEDLPCGEYAVVAFQDENDNKNLDLNANLMPSEKYGFSNLTHPITRMVRFEDCKFTVKEDTTIQITL